jgi:hypothetical protein
MSRGLGRMQCRILEALEPFQHHRWLAATIPTCTSSSPQRSMIWSVSAPTCASKTPPASEIAALVRSRSAAVWGFLHDPSHAAHGMRGVVQKSPRCDHPLQFSQSVRPADFASPDRGYCHRNHY